jgi:hypothetical protein
MRTVALLVAASVVWSSSSLAQPEAPPSSLPTLPANGPEPSAAPAGPAPTASPTESAPAPAEGDAPNLAKPPAPEPTAPVLPRAPSLLTHRGFYLRLSSGFAEVAVSGTAPAGAGSASVSGLGSGVDLAIGGSPAPGLAIGGVLQAAMATGTFKGGPQIVSMTTYPGMSQPTTETLSGHAQASQLLLGVFVDWFPNPHDGWHLGGSLGLGASAIQDDAYHGMTSVALGLGASGGYDWWLGRAFSAGVDVFVLGALQAHADDTHQNDTGYRLGAATFGIGGQVLYY